MYSFQSLALHSTALIGTASPNGNMVVRDAEM
jgi:hypothetical protein